jgi:hypothetical protein
MDRNITLVLSRTSWITNTVASALSLPAKGKGAALISKTQWVAGKEGVFLRLGNLVCVVSRDAGSGYGYGYSH